MGIIKDKNYKLIKKEFLNFFKKSKLLKFSGGAFAPLGPPPTGCA